MTADVPCGARSGDFHCTLPDGHPGGHEAHTCLCGGGGCLDGPVLTWNEAGVP